MKEEHFMPFSPLKTRRKAWQLLLRRELQVGPTNEFQCDSYGLSPLQSLYRALRIILTGYESEDGMYETGKSSQFLENPCKVIQGTLL